MKEEGTEEDDREKGFSYTLFTVSEDAVKGRLTRYWECKQIHFCVLEQTMCSELVQKV